MNSSDLSRGDVLAAVRAYFAAQGVQECWTPALVKSGGVDAFIDSFTVSPGGQQLHSSPEFAMKRLLAHGARLGRAQDIYQVATVFRVGESGPLHRPCFQLLEWYRVGWDHHRLMDEVEQLIRFTAEQVGSNADFEGITCDLLADFKRTTMREHLASLGVEPAATCEQMSASLAAALHTRGERSDLSAQERFHLLCSLTDRELGRGRATFVHGYPRDQAVLAALDEGRLLPAQRFELFVCGVELANGWKELTGAQANGERLQEENIRRVQAGLPPHPVDQDFLAAMDHLPPCAGVALGIDRLWMLLAGSNRIWAGAEN